MADELDHAIVWTEPSLCDLERIDRFLRRRSAAAARKTGAAILRRVGLLSVFPELGPAWEEDDRWRFVAVRPYRVFYRIHPADRVVEICHVRHSARSGPTLDDVLTD